MKTVLKAVAFLALLTTTASADEIRYATWAKQGEAQYVGAEEFKRVVEEKTDHTVTIFPGDQLGKPKEVYTQMALGTTQILASGDPGLKEIEYLALPYLMKGMKNYQDVLKTDFAEVWNEKLINDRKVRILGFMPRSPRQISANKPIETIEDLAGLKLRAPERDYYVKSLSALGASPTPMAFAEVYTALQTGVVDGQENPIETIYAQKFYEVQKGVAMLDYIVKPAYVTISAPFWDSLSEADQAVLIEANEASTAVVEKLLPEQQEKYLQVMKDAGVTITYPEKGPFIEATQSVRDELGTKAWGKDVYEQIKEIGAQ
ncbi:tripartite ATP-independent transporter solute receptor, DctP family [Cohaesibacter marisflavi]|uniref:Tripartite ATP-independent transporter solute receptor, DctP family n=1 Tax=Cohaesibacter marisflavi TaxID=655353 RepID=A0A1I5LKG6_9HYPH|nr:TRAP transporter substrate-binding protein [Cohaesibacter marisflavi]SFO97770.1 tripartite ATP-independent transporter solute receptor, DctP family [Cohaesibacter marisflavi]